MPIKISHHNNGSHTISAYPIVIAVILGGIFGIMYPALALRFKIVGDIFLNVLFVFVIPLIMSSMISAVSCLGDIRHLGSLGLKTIFFYLSTTFLAVLTGIILVNIIGPGKNIEAERTEFPQTDYSILQQPISGGSILSISSAQQQFPRNIQIDQNRIELIDQQVTGIPESDGFLDGSGISIAYWIDASGRKVEPQLSGTGIRIRRYDRKMSSDEILSNFVPRNIFYAMAEEKIFPLILFSLFFGIVLSTTGDVGKPLIQIIQAINVTTIKCVMLVMYIAPVGIFGLIAGRIGEAEITMQGGFLSELVYLAKYAATVIAGLAIHGCISLVLILVILGKRRPLIFFRNLIPQLLTAFATASSMAALPVALSLVTQKNKVSEKIADFVLPLGATVNMDGTALYEGVAAIFIAQLYNIQLGIFEQSIILMTATVAAIGAAAIPQAGLVTMVLVLRCVGLPLEGIGVILSIDWFLDRLRTTVNSWGDVVGAAVIDRFEGNSDS